MIRNMVDNSNEKPPRRPDVEILADAIKELAPQDEQEMRARLTRCIAGLRATARGKKAPTPAEMNKQLRARLKRMQGVRADLVATGSPKGLIELYDEHCRAVPHPISPPLVQWPWHTACCKSLDRVCGGGDGNVCRACSMKVSLANVLLIFPGT
jgi:hypothetical protein